MKPKNAIEQEFLTECKRCQKPFHAWWLDSLKKWSSCCEDCGMRNLFDGLGMHTPPDMLDKFTRKPTLTEAEWRKTLEPRKRKVRKPAWFKSQPSKPGFYEMKCFENGFRIERMKVFRKDGELWVNCPDLGRYPLNHYHNNLCDIWWRASP